MSTGTSGPEVELLLCCARTRLAPERAMRIRALLETDLDWTRVHRLARRHGLTSLLYRHLTEVAPGRVPTTSLDRLQDHVRSSTARNLYLAAALREILHQFKEGGMDALPWKGPVLATSLYGDVALREFGDLDILVRREHVPRARDVLMSLGYRPQLRLTRAQEAVYLQSACDYEFDHPDSGVHLELHWEVVPRHFPFRLGADGVWDRLERTSFDGMDVPTLATEDMLPALCVHGAKHLWNRLLWLSDVAELLDARAGLDWGQVLERARRLGSQRMLFLGLYLASDLLRAELPREIASTLRADAAVRWLAAFVRGRLFDDVPYEPGVLESSAFYLRAMERPSDRIRYCRRLLFRLHVGDWGLVQLPPSLWVLYYPLRAIRLGIKYAVGR